MNDGTAFVPSNAPAIPDTLLEPTPAPLLPDLNTVSDIDLGVLGLQDEKALESCNADKAKIRALLK